MEVTGQSTGKTAPSGGRGLQDPQGWSAHTGGGGALRLRRNGQREQQWCRHRLANAGPHRRRGAIRPTGSSAPVPGRPPVVYWPHHCFPDQPLRAVTSARAGAAVHTVSRDMDAHLQLPEVKTPECELKACGRGTCRRRRRRVGPGRQQQKPSTLRHTERATRANARSTTRV